MVLTDCCFSISITYLIITFSIESFTSICIIGELFTFLQLLHSIISSFITFVTFLITTMASHPPTDNQDGAADKAGADGSDQATTRSEIESNNQGKGNDKNSNNDGKNNNPQIPDNNGDEKQISIGASEFYAYMENKSVDGLDKYKKYFKFRSLKAIEALSTDEFGKFISQVMETELDMIDYNHLATFKMIHKELKQESSNGM